MVDRESPAVELTRHPAVSITGVLLDDRLDALDEIRFIAGLVLWLVVIRAAGQVHQLAPPVGAFDEGTILSNEAPLRFGGDNRPL